MTPDTPYDGRNADLPAFTSVAHALDHAILDAWKIFDRPRYYPNANAWHLPQGKTCHVCTGGAVIAMTLEAPRTLHVPPDAFQGRVHSYLYGLNSLRLADVEAGLDQIQGAVCDNRPTAAALFADAGRAFANRLAAYRDFQGKAPFHNHVEVLEDLADFLHERLGTQPPARHHHRRQRRSL